MQFITTVILTMILHAGAQPMTCYSCSSMNREAEGSCNDVVSSRQKTDYCDFNSGYYCMTVISWKMNVKYWTRGCSANCTAGAGTSCCNTPNCNGPVNRPIIDDSIACFSCSSILSLHCADNSFQASEVKTKRCSGQCTKIVTSGSVDGEIVDVTARGCSSSCEPTSSSSSDSDESSVTVVTSCCSSNYCNGANQSQLTTLYILTSLLLIYVLR